MIITISGSPGSGKSSIAKKLVAQLGCERVYAGGIMREMARERGLTLEQFMEYLAHDETLEKEIDLNVRDWAYELEREGKVVVVEGRVQYHLIPDSLKIYVTVDVEEGARRILKDLGDAQTSVDRNQQIVRTIEEMVRLNSEREETDAQRYMKLYGIDHRDKKQYDLVVDTMAITVEEAVGKIVEFLKGKGVGCRSVGAGWVEGK